MENLLTITLAKNPMFHNRSKHIDTRFHCLRDYITNKDVEVKYIKTQDQAADIFTKPLKHYVIAKMRDMLGVIKKLSLGVDVKSKPNFNFFFKIKELVELNKSINRLS